MRLILSVVLLVSTWACASVAAELYSEKELWAAGELWTETRVQWQAEQAAHQRRLAAIERSAVPEARKGELRRIEVQRHGQRSQILAAKRDQVQNVLVNEANARVRGGQTAASGQLVDTAGTKFGEAGHRGMAGDRDMGGGERTVSKVKEVLKEMGIYDAAAIKESAGTFEIGDDFELTINKDGARPRAGSEFHRVKAEVDARNPETYVSESMKNRSPDGRSVQKQAGTDYVEIQDHRKKAAEGLQADGKKLAASPDKVQKMAKGTVKTLDMGDLDDGMVGKILQQNGIKESPEAFRQRLRGMKEGAVKVADAGEAERLRRASEDIFNAAEQKAFNRAKQEIVVLREKAAALPAKDPKRAVIEDEIVDSVTKMKATRAANDQLASGAPASKATAKSGGRPVAAATQSGNAPSGRTTAQAELAALDDIHATSGKAKAAKAFGALMNIVDIGQSCQVVEDYMEGKVSLKDAATKIVDQHVTGGAIGTVERAAESHADYSAAQSAIEQANRENMAAYLNAWEVQLRKAGMTPAEARQYVGSAMLAGNLEKLEDKAQALAAAGKTITPPQLVVDTFEADDTLGQRIYGLGEGMVQGAYASGKYLVTAPSRTVEAWAEGELKEADLEAYAHQKDAEGRTEMFRKLLNAGLDAKVILPALNDWENGKMGPLKELFRQARANRQDAEPTAADLAAVEEENQRIAAEEQQRSQLVQQYHALLAYLRFAPITLVVDPAPVELAEEGRRALIRLAVHGPEKSDLAAVAVQIEQTIGQLTGTPGKVLLAYRFSCKGQPGAASNEWLTASPGSAGTYPVTVTMVVEVGTAGLGAPYGTLVRKFERSETAPVEVRVNADRTELSGEIWDIMRTTPELTIDMPINSFRATVSPAAVITFPVKYTINTYLVEGKGSLHFSTDGKQINELLIKTTTTDPQSGEVLQKDEKRLGPFTVYAADKETETQRSHLYYTISWDNRDIFGSVKASTREVSARDDGSCCKYGAFTERAAENITRADADAKTRIHFRMTDAAIEKKEALNKQLYQEKKQRQEAVGKAAAAGTQWAGPFGADEQFDGTIKLDVSTTEKVVSGSFKGVHMEGEDRKHILSGEFQGVINPKSGEITATIIKSSLSVLRLDKGKWYPASLAPQDLAKETRVLGRLDGNSITGHLEIDGKKGFAWSAQPVGEGGKK